MPNPNDAQMVNWVDPYAQPARNDTHPDFGDPSNNLPAAYTAEEIDQAEEMRSDTPQPIPEELLPEPVYEQESAAPSETPVEQPPAELPPSGDLNELTVAELKAVADDQGVVLESGMRKDEIIAALEE